MSNPFKSWLSQQATLRSEEQNRRVRAFFGALILSWQFRYCIWRRNGII